MLTWTRVQHRIDLEIISKTQQKLINEMTHIQYLLLKSNKGEVSTTIICVIFEKEKKFDFSVYGILEMDANMNI